jgi:hypothetical protein
MTSINPRVHGGITFTKYGTDNSLWIGFDCAHAWDGQDPELPKTYDMPALEGTIIRDTDYVRAECHRLCDQARAVCHK